MDAVLPSNTKPLADERQVWFVVKRTCEALLVFFCILIAIRFSAKVPPANLGQSKWSQFYGMILSEKKYGFIVAAVLIWMLRFFLWWSPSVVMKFRKFQSRPSLLGWAGVGVFGYSIAAIVANVVAATAKINPNAHYPYVILWICYLVVCCIGWYLLPERVGWACSGSIAYAVINLFQAPYLRHWILLLEACLIGSFFWPELGRLAASMRRTGYYARVAIALLGFGLFVKMIPGAYFPPFFGGITGWKYELPVLDTITVTAIQMVRDDGEGVWYASDLTSPQAFHHLQYLHYQTDDAKLADVLAYFFRLYELNYPYLEADRYRYQWALGPLAYPNHTPARMLDYKPFPPSRIVALRYASEIYDRKSHRLTTRIVHWSYDAITRQIVRTRTEQKFE